MTERVVMFYPYMTEQAIENAEQVLSGRWIGEGPKVKMFESALIDRFGFDYCLALNSGTSGIRLALALCDVGPGDEVITVAQTCTATNTPILEQYAKPVFADIQYGTGNIDPADIEHRITDRTRAILVVHWGGYPADLLEVHEIAARFAIPVIEDAAHALGATYHNQYIGNVSGYTVFSFGAIKPLTTVDGGALIVRDRATYKEGRRRRWYGIDRTLREIRVDGYAYWNQTEVGYKYNMNDVAAAIGLGNLTKFDAHASLRRSIALYYRAELAGVPGVTLLESKDDRVSADWLFTIHVEERDAFCKMMRFRGIETSVVHVRNDAHAIFGPLRDDLPQTAVWGETNVSIPLHGHMQHEDCQRVVDAIRQGWA